MKLCGMTDVGRVRRDNQDSYAFRQLTDDTAVLVVCDGMGGAQSGSVASAVAVESFSAAVEELCAGGMPRESEGRELILIRAANAANRRVYDMAQQNIECQGMGTTLVGALLLPGEAYIANVGDSRCYLLRDGGARQLTTDHSYVQVLVNRGEITPEEARRHPRRNVITRAVGVDSEVGCDLLRLDTRPGDRLLLCSDGLTNVLDDAELAALSAAEADPERCARALLEMTLERGAPDNVTVVLAEI